MMQVMLYVAAAAAIVLILIFMRNTIVPSLLRLSCFIAAFAAAFMPVYTLIIMGESMDLNALDLIKGLSFTSDFGYNMDTKSNLFYIVLFALPVIGAAITLPKGGKLTDIAGAILSLLGVFTCCLMLFKQIEIGNIIKLDINIGLVIMFIAYGAALAISIVRIYGYLNSADEKPIEPVNIDHEDIAEYFRNNEKAICKACGQENIQGCNYCKKCGEKL